MLTLLLACTPQTAPLAPTGQATLPDASVMAPPVASPGSGPTAPAPAAPQDVFPAPARVVAVGDLHGDVASAIGALELAKVVDATGHWTGGGTWLVQTGDVLDRGKDGPTMIRFLAQLEQEAAAAGGRALILDGNHEVMNLQGDWRYVADLAEFGAAPDPQAARRTWMAEGAGGAWVRGHGMVVQVGETVFVHAGIDSHWASYGVSGLNTLFRAALAAPPDPKSGVTGPDGPVWNRAYLLEDPPAICPELKRALAELHATRMVVGHTTQETGRIAERCEGTFYGIDTGISAYYGVHPSALVIEGSAVTLLP